MIKNKKTIVAAMVLLTYIVSKLMRKFLKFDQNSLDTFFTRPDLENLPSEIQDASSFCLWRYEYDDDHKEVKVPYRYDAHKRKIVKGMGDYKNYLICSLYQYNTLFSSDNTKNNFSLGLSLLDSGLSVIDIDHYQKHPVLDRVLCDLLYKGCYIEVSPSGLGLHIFYKGALDWSYGRNKGSHVLDCDGVFTSCEVYSCHDKRFITLTGEAWKSKSIECILPEAEAIFEELQELQALFFEQKERSLVHSIQQNLIAPVSTQKLEALLAQLLQRIQVSDQSAAFAELCLEEKPAKYASPSEADMAFAGMIALHADTILPKEHQIPILRLAFFRLRPQRHKLQRCDYVSSTISKALDSAAFGSTLKKSVTSFAKAKKSHQASKQSIIKVCNAMKIFHFGRTFDNHVYYSEQSGNKLTVTMPKSLNQVDFKYFAELLFQYVDGLKRLKSLNHDQIKKELLVVNIKTMLKSIGLLDGGSAYKALLASLDRLSRVHVKANKLIDKEKQTFSVKGGSLITYEYEKRSSKNTKTAKKQLLVRMHPVIVDMALESKYNYAILNKESYHSLDSDKTKLLYYHFCLSTLPGGFVVTFSVDDLLELWPKSAQIKQARYRNKRELLVLLDNLIQQIDEGHIQDLSIKLVYDQSNSLESVIVRKYHLRLV